MSTDYSASPVVGWIIPVDSFLRPLRKQVKEEFHLEDRFDQKSGKKVGQVKVVDKEGGWYYFFEGEEYGAAPDEDDCMNGGEQDEELLEAIGKQVGASIHIDGNFMNGPMYAVIQSKQLKQKDGEYPLKDVVKSVKELERIHRELVKLGLMKKDEHPSVGAVLNVS